MLNLELACGPAMDVAPGDSFADELSGVAGRIAAGALLALLSPVLTLALVLGRRGGTRLVGRAKVGKDGREYDEYGLEPGGLVRHSLFQRARVQRWPALWNVVRGDIALVGPRARTPEEVDPSNRRHAAVAASKPGLVCTWWIRRHGGIDYGSELESDLEYVRDRSPRTDLGILSRALVAAVYAERDGVAAAESRVLGVRTHNLSMDAAVDALADMASGDRRSQVCFANADCLNLACRDDTYRDTLATAQLVLPDGIGIRLGVKMTGQSIRHNVNGTDLFPRLCARLAREGRRVFLLGAKPGVPEKVQSYIEAHHPGLVVAGVRNGYFTEAEEPQVLDQIRRAEADVLLVAFGAPRQDVWIRDRLSRLGVRVAMGVGGLFDFYSFSLPRAPQWVREIGMEWAFRLIQEPRRLWKRYIIGNVAFLTRVMLEASGLVRYGAPEGAGLAARRAPVPFEDGQVAV